MAGTIQILLLLMIVPEIVIYHFTKKIGMGP
jgi:hypothetical protein